MTKMNGPLRVGIGGPVGAGKTTLTARLSEALKGQCSATNNMRVQRQSG